MGLFDFNLSSTASVAEFIPSPKPDNIARWINELPRLNIEENSQLLFRTLQRINQAEISLKTRIDCLALLRPEIDHVVKMKDQQYRSVSFPLPPKKQQIYIHILELLKEITFGYKIIIRELANIENPNTRIHQQLQTTLKFSVNYLAEIILHSYSLYMPDPKGAWKELHRLFRYANKHGAKTKHIKQNELATINSIYNRIVLLALANPYHLMQGEATTLFKLFSEWHQTCRIMPLASTTQDLTGRFFVDLKGSSPPCYATKDRQLQPIAPYNIDLSAVRQVLVNRIRELVRNATITLAMQMEVNRLIRLQSAWSRHAERTAPRIRTNTKLTLITSLTASHHFINHGQAFTPEQDEAKLHGNSFMMNKLTSLSLAPIDDESWKGNDMEAKLASGMFNPRSLHFDQERNEEDLWEKSQRDLAKQTTQLEHTTQTRLNQNKVVLLQKDYSEGGIGLRCPANARLHARVGEVVALKEKKADPDWKIGEIRWLQHCEDQTLLIGITHIAKNSQPCAVRSITGEGKGGEYMRALLLPRGDLADPDVTLLVPAALYDIGAEIILNLSDTYHFARLTTVLGATNSFARFQFSLIQLSKQRRHHILSSLYRLIHAD